MPIKLIALDLDGTLLTSKKQLSPRTGKALKMCIEHGIEVVLATGRMSAGILEVLRELEGIRYVIEANGALVEDIQQKKILYHQCIPKEEALNILAMVAHFPLMYDAHIGGSGKIEKRFLENLEVYIPEEEIRQLIRHTRSGILDLRSYIASGVYDVDKMNLTFKDIETREQVREKLSAIGDITITSSLSNNLELNHKLATKGNGLVFLTQHLHMTWEETMAFGDGENDITMLKQAGIGVAMENAAEYVKMQADYVTLSNDEDGIADAIEKLIQSTGIQAL